MLLIHLLSNLHQHTLKLRHHTRQCLFDLVLLLESCHFHLLPLVFRRPYLRLALTVIR
jgi:hypothetical protein